MITLRPYQQDFIDAFFKAHNNDTRRMLGVMPTGTGKTVVFSEIAKRCDRKALILAHRDELIQQAVDKLKIVWDGCNPGVVKAERNEINSHVTVASVQSLHKRRLKTLPAPGLIITDEAHHAAAPSYLRIYHRFGVLDESPDKKSPLTQLHSDCVHLGVTATPTRSDRKGLAKIFDEIIYDAKLFDFVPQFLCDLKLRGIDTRLDLSKVRVSKLTRDFDDRQLGEIMTQSDVVHDVLKAYRQFAADRKRTLAFCVNREHAHCLYEHFIENGIPSGYVDFETKHDERKQTIDDLKHARISALFNVGIFTEGFDMPAIDTILIARPTKSPLLLTQMIGRGTRNAEGKENCLIIDAAMFQRGNNAVNVASLFNLSASVLAHDPEKTIGKHIAEGTSDGYRKPEPPDPTVYTVQITLDSIFAIRDKFQATDYWHNKSVTDKQLAVINQQLAAIGEPPLDKEEITRGMASEMIDTIFASTPATGKQRSYMRYLGIKFNPKSISKPQACELISKAVAEREKGKECSS